MMHTRRLALRTLLALPIAGALAFGASQALASPSSAARAPDCNGFCEQNAAFCGANPNNFSCKYCGCLILP